MSRFLLVIMAAAPLKSASLAVCLCCGCGLGWLLEPFVKYWYLGSLIEAIRENIKYPRGLPSGVVKYLNMQTDPQESSCGLGPVLGHGG